MKLGKIFRLDIIAHSECPHCQSKNAHDLESPVDFSQIVTCIFCDKEYEIKYSVEYITKTGKVQIDETGIFQWQIQQEGAG